MITFGLFQLLEWTADGLDWARLHFISVKVELYLSYLWFSCRVRPVDVLGAEDGHRLERGDQRRQLELVFVGLNEALVDDLVQDLDVVKGVDLKSCVEKILLNQM